MKKSIQEEIDLKKYTILYDIVCKKLEELLDKEREKIMSIEVLKFSATWCGPCRVLAQNLEGVEGITNIDIDKDMETARSYNVRNVPLLVFKKNGKEVHRQTGAISKEQYLAIVTEINDAKEI